MKLTLMNAALRMEYVVTGFASINRVPSNVIANLDLRVYCVMLMLMNA